MVLRTVKIIHSHNNIQIILVFTSGSRHQNPKHDSGNSVSINPSKQQCLLPPSLRFQAITPVRSLSRYMFVGSENRYVRCL